MTETTPLDFTPSAVLFDLDGTLVDTAPDFHRAINLLRQEEGLAPIGISELRKVVSEGAAAMIKAAFAGYSDTDLELLRLRMLDLYLEDVATESRPFAGIEKILGWLGEQQIPWGVVTNKPWRYTEPLMAQLQLQPACGSIICPDHVTQSKPNPEGLLIACQQLSADPQNSIYIGDHLRDIQAGINAGMTTVGALYGYLSAEEQPQTWNAHFLAETPQHILQWLTATSH